MTIDTSTTLIAVTAYTVALFGLAWLTWKKWLPAGLVNNPLIYVLSLGISINTWSFYTSISTAARFGYGYLPYYIGYSLAFLFAIAFLRPIHRITRTYQLSSMADLFSFRFRSPFAGTLTTLVLLLCIFPMVGMQIRAVAVSAHYLVPTVNSELMALTFCLLVLLFTLLFGVGDNDGRDKHQGVIMALALETLVKLTALAAIGLYAIYGVFGGFGGLDGWLASVPPRITRLEVPFFNSSTNLMVLLFFTAAIAMPHMFHVIFKENNDPDCLKRASWGLPLILLVAAFPALPIYWAGTRLGLDAAPEVLILALGQASQSALLTLTVFVGGLAAAFGITMIIAMALANMSLNHLVLPLHKPPADCNLYQWLQLRRRLLISAIVLGGYLSYRLITRGGSTDLDIGISTFIICAQFLPGIFTLLYWPGGNRLGFISGILAGLAVWFALGLLPLLTSTPFDPLISYAPGVVNWTLVTILSLMTNLGVLILVSACSRTSEDERSAGEMCSPDHFQRRQRPALCARSAQEFRERLAKPLGRETAQREVLRALKDLGLSEQESRPYPLQQLRDQIEANLSGLLGPTIANQIIGRHLPYRLPGEAEGLDLSYIESRLEAYPGNLTGIALDLDDLRRHHRQVLQDLPLGVCSVGGDKEITLWNQAMADLTGLPAEQVVGTPPASLPEPWKALLQAFIEDPQSTRIAKKSISVNEKLRWVSLHKAVIEAGHQGRPGGMGLVIVVEDLTETQLLEAELAHAERLASIGRLAAGVAHEIGNPITGIACLAQNIRDETADTELREMSRQIIEQTSRASRIVQSLVRFSHGGTRLGDEDCHQPVSIHECAAEAIQLISLNQRSKDIQFVNDCEDRALLRTDKQRLQQILVNLLSNARDASPAGSTISVTNSITEGRVSIMITDQGDGIPEAIQDRIFEPFFTTKEPGKGTGLGLALVYSITEDLGGSVQILSPADSVSKKGTRVTVTFPCYHGNVLPEVEMA